MSEGELERLRALLEAGWPGFAARREEVELEGAPSSIAALWRAVGWAPVLDAWPDPRAVDHRAQLAEWIAEGRIEHEVYDEDADPDAEPEPEAIATAFPVSRGDLPARARVLRRSDGGGDFTLWIADEDRDDPDPPVMELSLRPTWAGPPPLGVGDFTRTLGLRATAFIASALVRDLGDRRLFTAAVSCAGARGVTPLPTLAPELRELAPGVWLEQGALAAGADRLAAESIAAVLDWARAGGARSLTRCSAPLGGASLALRGGAAALGPRLEGAQDLAGHRLGSLGGVAVWIAPSEGGGARAHFAERDASAVEAALASVR